MITPEARETVEGLLAKLPESDTMDYEALFNNTKEDFMTDYGLDEQGATELAHQGVEYAKMALANALGDREFLQNLLKESA